MDFWPVEREYEMKNSKEHPMLETAKHAVLEHLRNTSKEPLNFGTSCQNCGQVLGWEVSFLDASISEVMGIRSPGGDRPMPLPTPRCDCRPKLTFPGI